MPSQSDEYKRLRSFLNPAIKGKNTDSVLMALANGTSYLLNSVEAVNENLFITTASGQYLDLLLSQYGISRDPLVGLGDDVFRQIGIQVKNRKQVRDLIENLLDAVFGDAFTKATSSASQVEPYNLSSGDTLIISFDGGTPVTITFNSDNFTDIANAKAIEVANAIVSFLTSQSLNGSATTNNDGQGNYVQLVSTTNGPRSSITVLGGSAQNTLVFGAAAQAGGNLSTQWTLTTDTDGRMRFTWTGGANPNIGKLLPGYYVNVYGGGFASSTNVGTFTILNAVGGSVGNSYFDIYNPIGSPGIIVQGSDSAVTFFNPIKETLQTNGYYAALYNTQTNIVQIFLPATTRVVRRNRIGSSHLHDPPQGNFTFSAQPSSGDTFNITSSIFLVAGVNFTIGGTILETVTNMVDVINNLNIGLTAIVNNYNTVTIWNTSLSNLLTITYTGSQNILASGVLGSNVSLEPNQYGPYIFDTSQTFTVGSIHSYLTQSINTTSGRIIFVENTTGFTNGNANIIVGYGTDTQEIIPIIAVPSTGSILMSPTYTLQYEHVPGEEVRLIATKSPVVLNNNGSDYESFLTDVVSGRTYAQSLIQSVVAAGISVVFTVLYPSDIGLGKSGTIYSEIDYVYGNDNILP